MKKMSAKIKFLLLNLAVAFIVICGITIYVQYWLDDYTQHGSFIAVPSLYDLTPEEAGAVAAKARLKVQVVDSLYDENAKPGTILEQYPSGGSPVKENRMIHLTINARNPEKVVFPNLQNAAYRQTLQTLEARGFKIGQIEYIPSEFKNLVLNLKNNGREILPGTLLSKGATINIVLGSGEDGNSVYIPQLTGKRLKEAIDLVRKAYLNIGEIVPDGSINNQTNKYSAFVYEQNPGNNAMVPAGTPVRLYITLKQEKIAASDSLMITE